MNKDEFKKFFKYISSATTDTNPSPERTQVYWDLLNDLDFKVAMAAGKKVLATLENPFLPMPAIFRGAAVQITGPTFLTAPEAYEEALRAIRNYGGYREQEALESLSPLTRRAVESIGFKNLCYCEEPDVIRGQFRMNYEALEKRESIDSKMPIKLKELIDSMGAPKLKLAEPLTVVKLEEFKEFEEDEMPDDEVKSVRERMARAAMLRRKEG